MIHLILFTIITAIFIINQGIDVIFSSLFYKSDAGFYFNKNILVMIVYKAIPIISCAIVAISLLFIIIPKLRVKYCRNAIYVLVVLALGPGLLIHCGIKEYYCRPRPE